jgi:hypothetical protein
MNEMRQNRVSGADNFEAEKGEKTVFRKKPICGLNMKCNI